MFDDFGIGSGPVGRGMVWSGRAQCGVAQRGLVWPGPAWHGKAGQGYFDDFEFGMARLGMAWRGSVGQGRDTFDGFELRRGRACCGRVRQSGAWHGPARLGDARQGRDT